VRGVTEEKARSAVVERDGLAKQWFCVIRLWGHPGVSFFAKTRDGRCIIHTVWTDPLMVQ